MKIIVGLGNPGKKYDSTRHNIGWMFVDYLAKGYGTEITKSLCDSLVGETMINGEKIIFVKPTTFMNLSGNAVVKIKNWYKVEDSDILIVFDDIDIPNAFNRKCSETKNWSWWTKKRKTEYDRFCTSKI